jgi:hypothetical protein
MTGSGDFMSRPGMVMVFAYLDEHSESTYTVILDDLTCLGRDTMFHLMLRQELAAYRASVTCRIDVARTSYEKPIKGLPQGAFSRK